MTPFDTLPAAAEESASEPVTEPPPVEFGLDPEGDDGWGTARGTLPPPRPGLQEVADGTVETQEGGEDPASSETGARGKAAVVRPGLVMLMALSVLVAAAIAAFYLVPLGHLPLDWP